MLRFIVCVELVCLICAAVGTPIEVGRGRSDHGMVAAWAVLAGCSVTLIDACPTQVVGLNLGFFQSVFTLDVALILQVVHLLLRQILGASRLAAM